MSSVEELEVDPKRKKSVRAYMFNMSQKDDGINTDYNRTLNAIASNPLHKAQLADLLLDAYDPKKGFNLERFER